MLAEEYAGDFILAKVNVDENAELAGVLGIQGIPAVKLFRDGKIASEFTGALPEPMVREFLSKFLPSALDKQAQKAHSLEQEGRTADAKALYQSVVESAPNHPGALLGLGRLLMNDGACGEALERLDKIPMIADERKEADRLIARLRLQQAGAQDENTLRAKLDANPNDLETRFKFAQTLAAMERYEEALREFLIITKSDRSFNDDGARKAMIQIFEVLGSENPLTDKYRTELAKVLFS
jgi:putative thioredoxin